MLMIGQGTDAGSHNIDELFQIIVLAYLMAVFDALDISFIEQGLQETYFLLFSAIRQYLRKSAVEHIFIESGLYRTGICEIYVTG